MIAFSRSKTRWRRTADGAIAIGAQPTVTQLQRSVSPRKVEFPAETVDESAGRITEERPRFSRSAVLGS
jgi:hypothetical protein